MKPNDIAVLRGAVDDLNEGSIETFLSLMTEDMVWSGSPHGVLWWRERPH